MKALRESYRRLMSVRIKLTAEDKGTPEYQQVLDIRDTFDQGRKDEAVIKYMTMVNEVTILVYQEK